MFVKTSIVTLQEYIEQGSGTFLAKGAIKPTYF